MRDERQERPIGAQDVLADGVETAVFDGREVRKGTVAAFVANARALERSVAGTQESRRLEEELLRAVPDLRSIGVLDVFTPRTPRLAAVMGGAERARDR
ncbi:hypothetical protein [Williamsia phyllosphaerae]|uniref:Uncharacterized protein n=1 Tax=Williamsia phyllosphaerae TaxID=885042 RepID=A0ABQ1UWT3_9NOCA|nr:hypothetical protein [Williamsia phyllosphaerae]GGF28519.1 hypothetical protein GCM10007298_25380 [Williamsia phyllosphaerae]